jgi:hypothetical protein
MNASQWTARIEAKGMDPEAMAGKLAKYPEAAAFLLEGMATKKARMKYGCDKVLRELSRKRPELVYPHFDECLRFLSCDNAFLRWGMIQTLPHMAAVDSKGKFRRIFRKYYAPVGGTEMVAAVSAIGGSPRIARALPELRERIVREILKVEKARFEMHGKPSPECVRVACGQALEVLEDLYPLLEDRRNVDAFIRRQTRSTRPAVRKKALRLVKDLGL